MRANAEWIAALVQVVQAHLPVETYQWFEAGMPRDGVAFSHSMFFGYYAGAGRRLRALPFALTPADSAALAGVAGLPLPLLSLWTLPDFARAALLLAGCSQLTAAEQPGFVREAYSKGDNAERIAVLRALPLLPEPARFVGIGEESCRTHVLDVFSAIATDNPYPAQCFSDVSFNQLVIKALFLEVPASRIVGLTQRKNPELYRMARDYAAERRAAGRVVTPDTAFVAEQLEQAA